MNVPFMRILAVGSLVLLAACGNQSPPSAPPSVPNIEQPNTGGPHTATMPVTPAAQPPAEAPAPPAPVDRNTSATGECKAADLTLSIGDSEGAAGTIYRPVVF